jgi:hypothetical protein
MRGILPAFFQHPSAAIPAALLRGVILCMSALRNNLDGARHPNQVGQCGEPTDTFSRNTRLQLRQLLDAVRELTTPPDPPKRPIGFITPEDTKDKPKGSTAGRGKKT